MPLEQLTFEVQELPSADLIRRYPLMQRGLPDTSLLDKDLCRFTAHHGSTMAAAMAAEKR